MFILGLVLIAVAVAVGAGAVFDGGEAASVELLGTTVDTTVAGVFFAGAATMLVFMLGLLMMISAMGRSRRKRHERKEAKRRQRDSVQALEQERAQLRAENERLAGQLGGRDGTTSTDRTAAGTAATGSGTVDRDRDGQPDATEGHSGSPLRESDGPAVTGRGTRARSDGTDDATQVDLREPAPTRRGDART